MESKLLNLAVGKLSDDVQKLQDQFTELMSQFKMIQLKKETNESQPLLVQSNETEFITLQEVRKILKMSRNSVLQMARNGLVRQVRLTKRTVRYVKSEILKLTQS